MRFVGNYALRGLAPQTDGMPVIPKLTARPEGLAVLIVNIYASAVS